MVSGEVSWEEENDVKEIIADVRDAECEMSWCVLRPHQLVPRHSFSCQKKNVAANVGL
jgi:hypothetical protein